MKTQLCNHIANALPDSSTDTIAELLAVPPEEYMGDFALPCFSFAKALRKSSASFDTTSSVAAAFNRFYHERSILHAAGHEKKPVFY